ncbi:hypothetical protein FPV67DRAFT_1776368 [Lyophyllum atratum]|nr:hypothetical protein FPV67DRAFT_1776368 [Lyophyllum atratum]
MFMLLTMEAIALVERKNRPRWNHTARFHHSGARQPIRIFKAKLSSSFRKSRPYPIQPNQPNSKMRFFVSLIVLASFVAFTVAAPMPDDGEFVDPDSTQQDAPHWF